MFASRFLARSRPAFTIIDLLIVVIVIAILAALLVMNFRDTKEKAYIAAMMNDVRNFALANEQYFADHGAYASAETLKMLGLFALSPDVETDSIDYTRGDGFFYRVRHKKTPVKCEIDYGQGRENRVRCDPSNGPSPVGPPDDDTEEPPVDDDNLKPVAHYTLSGDAFASWGVRYSSKSPIQADGSSSYDPDGTIVQWTWSTSQDGVIGTGVVLTHTFDPGVYTLTLTVTDDKGATASYSRTVEVVDLDPPVAVINVTYPPDLPEPPGPVMASRFGLDGSESYDPDGGTIEWFYWEFGDQQFAGHRTQARTASFHVPGPGEYPIRLTVVDDDGLVGSTTVTYQVIDTGTPLSLTIDCPPSIYIGEQLVCTATKVIPSGQQILNRSWQVRFTEHSSYRWDFLNRDTISMNTSPGTTPPGLYTVTYSIMFSGGSSAGVSAVVEFLDGVRPCDPATDDCGEPPIAVLNPPTAEILPGESVSFSALESSDPDGEIVQYKIEALGQTYDYPEVTITFRDLGKYVVYLTVYDDRGNQAQTFSVVNVIDYDQVDPPPACEMGDGECGPVEPPIVMCPAHVTPVDLNPTMTPSVPNPTSPTVRFTANTNGARTVVDHEWEFGPLAPAWFGATKRGNPVDVDIPFTAIGLLKITLRMTDANGCEHTANFQMIFEWDDWDDPNYPELLEEGDKFGYTEILICADCGLEWRENEQCWWINPFGGNRSYQSVPPQAWHEGEYQLVLKPEITNMFPPEEGYSYGITLYINSLVAHVDEDEVHYPYDPITVWPDEDGVASFNLVFFTPGQKTIRAQPVVYRFVDDWGPAEFFAALKVQQFTVTVDPWSNPPQWGKYCTIYS